jgi:hypothetical protein
LIDPLPPQPTGDIHARTSAVLVVLIIIAAIVVVVQYTPWALFPHDTTSTLWGVLVGLILGGMIFGWLRFSTRD